jgi:hypothetical protein
MQRRDMRICDVLLCSVVVGYFLYCWARERKRRKKRPQKVPVSCVCVWML